MSFHLTRTRALAPVTAIIAWFRAALMSAR